MLFSFLTTFINKSFQIFFNKNKVFVLIKQSYIFFIKTKFFFVFFNKIKAKVFIHKNKFYK